MRFNTIFLGACAGFSLASCVQTSTVLNPNHCANQSGDSWCGEQYPDGSRAYCARGSCDPSPDGCVVERPLEDACYSPCGNGLSADESPPDCIGVGSDSTSGDAGDGVMTMDDTVADTMADTLGDTDDTTTDGPGDTDSTSTGVVLDCQEDVDCAANDQRIFCIDNTCVDCSQTDSPDASCQDADSDAPICDTDGNCVTCLPSNNAGCDDQTPICDAGTSQCRACLAHSDCPDSACKIPLGTGGTPDDDEGACFSPDSVLEPIDISELDQAVLNNVVGEAVIQINAGEASVNFDGTFDGNRDLAILVVGNGAVPQWQRTIAPDAPTLTISDNASVWIEGLGFETNNANGDAAIDVNSARLYLQRARVVENDGGAITIANGGSAAIENSFLGGDVSDTAVVSSATGNVRISYSTLAGGFGSATAITCGNADAVEVNDSILATRGVGPVLACVPAEVVTSATEPSLDTGWFIDFSTGDFHLAKMGVDQFGAAEGIAEWNDGDPTTDIDGDLRPNVNGTADVAGADIP